jgi:cell division protein FtsB
VSTTTSGTARAQREAEPRPSVAPRRALSHEGPRLTGRAGALLIAVILLALLALVPARQWLDQRGRIVELERRATELEAQNDALREEVRALHDPVELERLARECLGMVAPGETALLDPAAERPDC